MRKRVAEKVLRYKDKLRYSNKQIKEAEAALKDIENRRQKKKRSIGAATEGGA